MSNRSAPVGPAPQRQQSTASLLEYGMFLTPLAKLQALVKSAKAQARPLEAHQVLLHRGDLVGYGDLPLDAVVIFVSHEWLAWKHADPDGLQLGVLCRTLERLAGGELDTEMHLNHQIAYNQKRRTTKKQWKQMFADDKVYIWFDWLSMPQIKAAPTSLSAEQLAELQKSAKNAIRSIAAYIELCDFMVALAPGGFHKDRKCHTNLASYRSRG